MKPRWIHPLVFVFATAISFGQPKPLEPMRGISRGQPAPALAVLMIGVNEMIGSVAEPGWPLIIAAVRQPDDKTAALPLPTNLRVKLTDNNGAEVAMTFISAPQPPTNATGLYWLADEATTTRLTPGLFHVTLVPGQGNLTGWRVESADFRIAAPNPERNNLVGHLRIHRSILLGRDDDALSEIDRLIAADTKDQDAWVAKGDLLMLKDKPDEALQAYDRALSLHKKTDRESLAILSRRRSAILRSLEKRGVVPAAPPTR